MLLAAVAGSCHEQGAAALPLLFILAVYLYAKKIPIPSWYWWGIAAYSFGLIFLLLPAGNEKRFVEYGSSASWEFMGQHLNWMELGWKRYFYSFANHFILGSYKWLLMPYLLAFGGLYLLFRSRQVSLPKSTWFYFALFLLSAVSMSASPMFRGGPEDNPLFFLFISLMILYHQGLKENLIPLVFAKRCTAGCLILILVFASLQSSILWPMAKDYRKIRGALIEESLRKNKHPIVAEPLTVSIKLPLDNHLKISFVLTTFLLGRYGFEEITVTNTEGERRIITRDSSDF